MNELRLPRKAEAARALRQEDAPRVFSPGSLTEWLGKQGLEVPPRTLSGALTEWAAVGNIEKINREIYLNLHAFPRPLADEAAAWVRPLAVVSLQRVLGQAGVLNNPSRWITCVVPMVPAVKKGSVDAGGHTFQFGGLPNDLLPAGDADWASDCYEPFRGYQVARPEKALLDLLYLSTSPAGRASRIWTLPSSHDWDISDLDTDRLDRLSQRMGLVEVLTEFRATLDSAKPRFQMRRARAPSST